MTTTLSIVIPFFNAQNFVADAIASVLAQTHRDLECILIDDASTDGSRALVERLATADSRIRLIHLPVNGGPAKARQAGLQAVSGTWVTFLDSDDLYEPDRLERLLRLATATGATGVVDNQSVRNFPDGPHLYDGFKFLNGEKPIPISADIFFEAEADPGTHLKAGYMKPMIRVDWLRKSGIEFDPRFRVAEDFLLYGELFAQGLMCFGTSYTGYIYRRRLASISRSSAAVDLLQMAFVSDELTRKHGYHLSPRSLAAIARRARDLKRFAALNSIREGLRRKDAADAWRAFVLRPDCVAALGLVIRRRFVTATRKAAF